MADRPFGMPGTIKCPDSIGAMTSAIAGDGRSGSLGEFDSVSAVAFGFVKGMVRPYQQGIQIIALLKSCNSHAGRTGESLILEFQVDAIYGRTKAFGEGVRFAQIPVRQQEGEFFAADPGQ